VSSIILKVSFGKNYTSIKHFKNEVILYSPKELREIYVRLQKNGSNRETDLNKKCINKIITSLKGHKILEVGCGKGYLSRKISTMNFKVTACDFVIDKKIANKYSTVKFIKADILKLPFKNNSFDTVICTHTLEHIVDINKAYKELLRIAKKRIIIVVPKERPYRHTPNLHVHFFPYGETFSIVVNDKHITYQEIDGDLFILRNK
jgi:ubiquinone/menaquinone biosynthesis C-methylase UbiE